MSDTTKSLLEQVPVVQKYLWQKKLQKYQHMLQNIKLFWKSNTLLFIKAVSSRSLEPSKKATHHSSLLLYSQNYR